MSVIRKTLIGGNWKMNGSYKLCDKIVGYMSNWSNNENTEIVICPPVIYTNYIATKGIPKNVSLCIQNCHMQESGAFTGEISANMIKDINVNWVLIGHSERRHKFGETNQMIAKKVKHAIDNKLNIIWCIGELLEERERNETLTIVDTQLSVVKDVISNDDWKNLVIAYEPVWAIGTGKNADTKTVQEVHQYIREWLTKNISKLISDCTRIIYGGSVTAKNCRDLASAKDIDGFLVGGASLKEEFIQITKSFE